MEVDQIIRRFVVTELLPNHRDRLRCDEPLVDILDSLDFESLILFIEKQFEIRIEDLEMTLDNFETIDTLAAFLKRKLAAKGTTRGTDLAGPPR